MNQRVELHLKSKKDTQTMIIIDAPNGFGDFAMSAEDWKYAAAELIKKSEVWHVRGPIDVPDCEEVA